MRFQNKVAIVTGGGSGIGLETAKGLHAEGASLLLNGRDEAKLSKELFAITVSWPDESKFGVIPQDRSTLRCFLSVLHGFSSTSN